MPQGPALATLRQVMTIFGRVLYWAWMAALGLLAVVNAMILLVLVTWSCDENPPCEPTFIWLYWPFWVAAAAGVVLALAAPVRKPLLVATTLLLAFPIGHLIVY
jgi:hypothetical protein